MSSVRLHMRPVVREVEDEFNDAWVELRSPKVAPPVGDITPVQNAIHALRLAVESRTERGSISFSNNDGCDYGSGDRALADDVAEDLADRWDD